jgi:transposase
LTDAERAGRERVRLQAVAGFEAGEKNREIAAALPVSERSVERWRRQWCEEDLAGVASKGFAWQASTVGQADSPAGKGVGERSAGPRVD